jgi:hypothetical protein
MDEDMPGLGDNHPPAEDALEMRLAAIDPTKLTVVAVDEVAPLLDLQYPGLKARFAELMGGIDRWTILHQNGIADDADLNKTSTFMRQIAGFGIGDKSELRTAHGPVKGPIHALGKAVDAWFGNLADPLKQATEAMNRASTVYLRQKADRERRAREEESARAQREANERARAAREALEAEQKAAALARQGEVDAAAVVAATEKADAALAHAQEAEEKAAMVQEQASASVADLVRQRSASGVTTTLATSWTYRVEDMKALCAAVAAGTVPVSFVMVNDAVVKASIRGKAGLREIAGLVIEEDFKARRSGA